MIFQHTFQKVLSGEKTQTRRIYKPNKHFASFSDNTYWAVYGVQGAPPIYELGHTYAVQPGRGKKSVGRIMITQIRREDVRCISYEDAQVEGFGGKLEFLETWVRMHDHTRQFFKLDSLYRQWRGVARKWEVADAVSILDCLEKRPDEYYQAWALNFELVKPSS